jgi:uncharacterized protein
MTRLLALAGGLPLALVVAAASALAQALVPVPPLKGPVTDLTGTLSAQQIATLEQSLRDFEARKGSQIAVLLVPSTRPEAIEQYSIRVAESWKIGRKKVDDGVIIVVAKNDHQVRIEVGYGLEGAIPDVYARRVIREQMAPHFVENDFYGGLAAATTQLMKLIDGEKLPPAAPRSGAQRGGEADPGSLLVVLLVLVVSVGAVLTRLFGRFLGSAVTGGLAGLVALALVGTVVAAVGAGMLAFLLSLMLGGAGWRLASGRRGGGWTGGGGWSGGGWGGGASSGGGWSGGGGGFGGGGASGRW